ncbi:hypothetical protein FRC01_012598 [Tulasnella sp. 417]|nr:hypothetical protein FRC01_012598 [Tulasnella sp. 417]
MALGSVATTTAGYGTGFPGPPQAVATDNPNSGNTGGTNGLYLYTFLITLMVLLSVASLIIVRSCILRRRFRRQVQLAIDGGGPFALPPHLRIPGSAEGGIPVVLTGRHGPGRRRKEKVVLGAKPVMSEIWMEKQTDEDEDVSGEKRPHSAMIQPISTTVVRPTLPDPAPPANGPPTTPPTASPFILTRETAQEYFGVDMRSFREVVNDNWRNTRENLQSFGRTLAPRPRPSALLLASLQGSRTPVSRRTNSNSNTPNRRSGIVTPQEDDALEKRLAVGFLIAMPDARRPTYHSTAQTDQHPGAFKIDLAQSSPTSDTFPYSPEELERGKMKALGIAGENGSVGGFETDDGELPPVVFGIVDVDWTGQKVPPSMAAKPQSGTGGR